MATATSQDTEITLGTGKMLALFFGLVALCAIFFGMGFSLGRTSVRIASPDLPATTTVTTSGVRPSAVKTASANPPADMTFYKTVASKDGNSQPAAKDAPPPASEATAPAASTDNSPDPATPPPANSYFVQVAAVSKAEDAAALVDALKKNNILHSPPTRPPTNSSTCKSAHIPTSKTPNSCAANWSATATTPFSKDRDCSRRTNYQTVILSAVAFSRSEKATQSKDPYPHDFVGGQGLSLPQRLDLIQAPHGSQPSPSQIRHPEAAESLAKPRTPNEGSLQSAHLTPAASIKNSVAGLDFFRTL